MLKDKDKIPYSECECLSFSHMVFIVFPIQDDYNKKANNMPTSEHNANANKTLKAQTRIIKAIGACIVCLITRLLRPVRQVGYATTCIKYKVPENEHFERMCKLCMYVSMYVCMHACIYMYVILSPRSLNT